MSANLEMGKEEKTRRKVWGSLGSPQKGSRISRNVRKVDYNNEKN